MNTAIEFDSPRSGEERLRSSERFKDERERILTRIEEICSRSTVFTRDRDVEEVARLAREAHPIVRTLAYPFDFQTDDVDEFVHVTLANRFPSCAQLGDASQRISSRSEGVPSTLSEGVRTLEKSRHSHAPDRSHQHGSDTFTERGSAPSPSVDDLPSKRQAFVRTTLEQRFVCRCGRSLEKGDVAMIRRKWKTWSCQPLELCVECHAKRGGVRYERPRSRVMAAVNVFGSNAAGIIEATGIGERTVQTILRLLVDEGSLTCMGRGRRTTYHLQP